MAVNHWSLLYLWDKRTLYIGELMEVITLTPASSSLMVGLEKPFEFWTPTQAKVATRIALIPAGMTLSVDHGNQPIACCYLDPMNNDHAVLERQMRCNAGGVSYNSERFAAVLASLTTVYNQMIPPAEAYRCLLQDVFAEPVYERVNMTHYHQIKKAIAIIKANPTDNVSNHALAEQVGLSESQLQRQFKAITGVPIRRFRLWHRLFITATLMGMGLSLTDASLEAGFSDASHFNHTFKSMLGMKPSFVLKRRDQIKIFAGGNHGCDQAQNKQPNSLDLL